MANPENWDAQAMQDGIVASRGLEGLSENIDFIYRVQWLNLSIAFLIYFIGGFLLYSGIFAMIGAMVDSETETQSLVMPVILPLMLAYFVAAMMIENPESTIATWFSIIPFTSPVVMGIQSCAQHG